MAENEQDAQKRRLERRRLAIVEDVRQARLEHERGETREVTPDELMAEILAE
jgi:hypothetical protein